MSGVIPGDQEILTADTSTIRDWGFLEDQASTIKNTVPGDPAQGFDPSRPDYNNNNDNSFMSDGRMNVKIPIRDCGFALACDVVDNDVMTVTVFAWQFNRDGMFEGGTHQTATFTCHSLNDSDASCYQYDRSGR